MSDDLVKRLRDWEHVWPDDMDKPAGHLYEDAADRIEELEAKLAEQIEWVKGLADDLIAAEGREARLKEKLAKAVELALEECPFRCGMPDYDNWWRDYRTTLAELTGGKDE